MPREDALRRSLEEALAADPDDLAAHSAYADYLMEQGDPRGELIQVQLALEDSKRPPAELRKLRAREKQLLSKHRAEWLGDLAPLFFPGPDDDIEDLNERFDIELLGPGGFEVRFARGWIDGLILAECSGSMMKALTEAPAARLLRGLTVTYASFTHEAFQRLARSPMAASLRRLLVGPSDGPSYIHASKICEVVARAPHLEELYLYAHEVPARKLFAMEMPRLRKLRVHHLTQYPLGVLARNPSLANLEELSCWPHALHSLDGENRAYIRARPFRELCLSPHLTSLTRLALHLTDFGDDGARSIVESGLLKRLRVLDLWSGCITDAGARLLAASPHIHHLQTLRIGHNNLSPTGLEALREAGANVESDHQFRADEIVDGAHLWDGDME